MSRVEEAAPRPKAKPSAVLFVCGMNAIRSPMAETLARSILGPGVYVASAGVRSGNRDPFVDVVLGEAGLTLGRRQPQTLEELEDGFFDVIVTLAPEAHHRVLDMTRTHAVEVVYWPTPDPTSVTGSREQVMDAYRAVREHLGDLIERRFGAGTQQA